MKATEIYNYTLFYIVCKLEIPDLYTSSDPTRGTGCIYLVCSLDVMLFDTRCCVGATGGMVLAYASTSAISAVLGPRFEEVRLV